MTLEELIARFEREHPAEMAAAREALKANPLTHHDIISADITDIMLMHEVNRLRAELTEAKRDVDRINWMEKNKVGIYAVAGSLRSLLLMARAEVEFWTPDESNAGDDSLALSGWFDLRDLIDAAMAGGEHGNA